MILGGNAPYDVYGKVHPEDFPITVPPLTTFKVNFTFPKSGT